MAKQTSKPAASIQNAPVDGRETYTIAAKAPPYIAGRRIQTGQTEVRLTEQEARSELLAGHILPSKGIAAAPAPEPSTEL